MAQDVSPGWTSHSTRKFPVGKSLPSTAYLDIFSRPYGTGHISPTYPGLPSWATLSRPYGTSHISPTYPGLPSWATLSRPFGTGHISPTYPGLPSWATLSRPFGTLMLSAWVFPGPGVPRFGCFP